MSQGIALVIDNGSGYLKMGKAPSERPEIVLPTLIGRKFLREDAKKFTATKNKVYGDVALNNKDNLDLKYPITNGIITDKDDLAELWEYAIEEKLKIPKEEYNNMKVLVTEAPGRPEMNKVNILDILFEKLKVGYASIEPQASLCLYCEGKTTGIVLDSGDGVTHCIPIIEGMSQKFATCDFDLAGRYVSQRLVDLLMLKGYNFNASSDFQGIKELKENNCFVSADIEKDRKLARDTTYYNSYHLIDGLLPDNERVFLSNEKFEAVEILFDGSIDHHAYRSLPEMLHWSVMKSPIDYRKELFANVVLSGGNTLFPGFISRLESCVKNILKAKIDPKAKEEVRVPVIVSDHHLRKYAVYIGGSVYANYYNTPSGIQNYWISRKDYEEAGPNKIKFVRDRCKSLTSGED